MRIFSLFLSKKMARKRHRRKILEIPQFKGYKPYGDKVKNNGSVELLYEEYEAIKLADYYLLNHEDAGFYMGISRATFARIYEKARQKIAQAMFEVKEIIVVPGNTSFDKTWFLCNDCNNQFTTKDMQYKRFCPSCNSNNFYTIQN